MRFFRQPSGTYACPSFEDCFSLPEALRTDSDCRSSLHGVTRRRCAPGLGMANSPAYISNVCDSEPHAHAWASPRLTPMFRTWLRVSKSTCRAELGRPSTPFGLLVLRTALALHVSPPSACALLQLVPWTRPTAASTILHDLPSSSGSQLGTSISPLHGLDSSSPRAAEDLGPEIPVALSGRDISLACTRVPRCDPAWTEGGHSICVAPQGK
ncbi:hypothetical protein PsYK624_115130 [Phanerochaete sordida]|uniref:Uncharacterized protein n=1 Tax=Phanerochaete sordida TaxID=48140 RepID=A0A9P3GKU7_9APHY|nr:hypothetical protein PsYK624_115130 [Phanerochaete sordida]